MANNLLSSGLIEDLVNQNTKKGFNLASYINVMYPYQQEIAYEAIEIAANLP